MTPLVLIPGLMCDGRLFGPQVDAFSGLCTLVLANATGAETMAELAARVLAEAPPRFALAGLSMGGIVAMEVVRQAPDRVERLALLDTNPLAEAPEVAGAREPQMKAACEGRLRAVMRDELKPRYLALGPRRADILDLVIDMAEALGPDVFVRQSRALQSRPDQTATLASYPRPTLILCGASDMLCPPSRHEMMHDLVPGSVLRIVSGAGHMPTLETPEVTNAALMEWYRR